MTTPNTGPSSISQYCHQGRSVFSNQSVYVCFVRRAHAQLCIKSRMRRLKSDIYCQPNSNGKIPWYEIAHIILLYCMCTCAHRFNSRSIGQGQRLSTDATPACMHANTQREYVWNSLTGPGSPTHRRLHQAKETLNTELRSTATVSPVSSEHG